MHTNFCIRVRLRSELVVSQFRMTADAWLAGLEYERTNDHVNAIASLPFATWYEVPMASELLPGYLPDAGAIETVTYYTQPARDLQFDPMITRHLRKPPSQAVLTAGRQGRGDLGSFGSTYQTMNLTELFFACRGDMAEVKRRLIARDGSPIPPTMGRQDRKGHAVIDRIELIPMPNGNHLFGIVGGGFRKRSVILRPVPRRLESELPPVDSILVNRTWRNPYWTGHDTAEVDTCLSPPFMQGQGFHLGEIKRMAVGFG